MTLIDCPPGECNLQLAALVAVDHAAVPLRLDTGSRAGLRRIAVLYRQVSHRQPDAGGAVRVADT